MEIRNDIAMRSNPDQSYEERIDWLLAQEEQARAEWKRIRPQFLDIYNRMTSLERLAKELEDERLFLCKYCTEVQKVSKPARAHKSPSRAEIERKAGLEVLKSLGLEHMAAELGLA